MVPLLPILLLVAVGGQPNATHSFDFSDPIVWQPAQGLTGRFYEDVSFVITSEKTRTLEVVLFIKEMPHRISLHVRSSNDDADKADPRIRAHANCYDFVDECRQQQLFQYTQPSFLEGHSGYKSRIALRVQAPYPGQSLTGRWTVSIGNDLGGTTADVKLVVWQRTYGYWDVLVVVVLVGVGSVAALVAMWDFLSSIGSKTRVLRPAEEGRVVRRRVAAVYQQMSDATSLLRENPVAQQETDSPDAPNDGQRQVQRQRARKQLYKMIFAGAIVAVVVIEAALLLTGYAFKVIVGVLTLDLAQIVWQVDMYHHLVGVAVILAYLTHTDLFMGSLEKLVPPRYAVWRYVLLVFSLLLEVVAGYVAHFILWSISSTVWEWQVHYCKGYALVLLYGMLAHNLITLSYERWQSQYIVEHVIEPPGRGKAGGTESDEDKISMEVEGMEGGDAEVAAPVEDVEAPARPPPLS